MATPGLFPDVEARFPRFGSFVPVLLLIVLVALAVVHGIWTHMRVRALEEELAGSQSQIESLKARGAENAALKDHIRSLQEVIARLRESRPDETAPEKLSDEPAGPVYSPGSVHPAGSVGSVGSVDPLSLHLLIPLIL